MPKSFPSATQFFVIDLAIGDRLPAGLCTDNDVMIGIDEAGSVLCASRVPNGICSYGEVVMGIDEGGLLLCACAGTESGALTWYEDADGDHFGDPGSTTLACLEPEGFLADSSDCLDTNAEAHPAQTSFFTAQRGDGSFDYNCDEVEEPNPGDSYLSETAEPDPDCPSHVGAACRSFPLGMIPDGGDGLPAPTTCAASYLYRKCATAMVCIIWGCGRDGTGCCQLVEQCTGETIETSYLRSCR